MNCIAIDLHTDNFTVARRKLDGEETRKITAKYSLSPSSLKLFTKSLHEDDYVAIESTLNSFWFYDKIRPFVKRVIIFDTTKVNYSGNKTDKIDARKLLDTLEYYIYIKGEKEIPDVYVPETQIRELRELFATYKLQKKMIIQLKNRIHSIFK